MLPWREAAYVGFLMLMYCLDFSPYSVDFHTLNVRCETSSAAHASRSPECEGGVRCMPMTAPRP